MDWRELIAMLLERKPTKFRSRAQPTCDIDKADPPRSSKRCSHAVHKSRSSLGFISFEDRSGGLTLGLTSFGKSSLPLPFG
jgi:hypothetical protein